MADFPNRDELFNAQIAGPEAMTLMGNWFEASRQMPGAQPWQEIAIENGSIAPTAAEVILDTEAQAESSVLHLIDAVQARQGMLLYLKAASPARRVIIKHDPWTINGIRLLEGQDVELSDQAALCLKLEGNSWVERVETPLASPQKMGLVAAGGRPGQVFRVDDSGQSYGWRSVSPYELCEFYFFRHQTLRPGFQPAQGGLIQNAATLYPEAWAYLQTTEGQKLCKTEAEWQAMTQATWATLANGTKVGWNGIGGAPFYAPDTATGALRLPDLRGMYAEAAGFDSLGVGGVHGDGIRNLTGYVGYLHSWANEYPINGLNGVFQGSRVDTPKVTNIDLAPGSVGDSIVHIEFNAVHVIPISAKNQPRAWGALACVYLGSPK